MDLDVSNWDDLYYDYIRPIRDPEHLYGRQEQLDEIQRFVRRAEGGLGLIIGGARSGRTSLLRSVDYKYQRALAQQRQHQLQGQVLSKAQTPVVLTYYFSMADELAGLEADELEVGSASSATSAVPFNQGRLHKLMLDAFSLEELRTLCFQMNVDYELLAPQGKAGTVREFILRIKSEHRIPELINRCGAARGSVEWESVYEKTTSGLPMSSGPEREEWYAGKLCEQLIRGLRERARDVLDVCGIESGELDFLPLSSTPTLYVTETLRKVRQACHDKMPAHRLKLVLLADDADAFLERQWRFKFLMAFQTAFSEADLVLTMAGGHLLHAAGQDMARRSVSPFIIRVNNLNQDDARLVAEEPLEGKHFPDAFMTGVHVQTGGHPYLLKLVLNNVKSRSALIAQSTPERLRQNAQSLVHEDPTLQDLFSRWDKAYGEIGRSVYRLLLDAGRTMTRDEIVLRAAEWIQSTQLDLVMEVLCYQGVVAKSIIGTESYSIAGEMFADWFREKILPTLQPPLSMPSGPAINIFSLTS